MRVLGASELRILWEVVVRGTLDKALDVLRQNVAMGWAMITMVEGISRAEGGIGALILNQNKHFLLAEVYAILLRHPAPRPPHGLRDGRAHERSSARTRCLDRVKR